MLRHPHPLAALVAVAALAVTGYVPASAEVAAPSRPPTADSATVSAATNAAQIEEDRAAIIAALRAEDVPTEDGRDELGQIIATSNALIGIPVSGARYERAKAAFDQQSDALDDLNRRLKDHTETLAALADARNELSAHRAEVSEEVRELTDDVARATDDITTIAVSRYLSDPERSSIPDPRASIEEQVTREHSHELSRSAFAHASELLADQSSSLSDASADLHRTTTAIAENSETATVTSFERDRLERDRAEATSALADAARELLLATANATVSGSDLSLVAMDAYWRAADAVRVTQPSCGIEWWALAGIGRTESRHGTYAGGEPGPDGRVSVPITCIALDGSRNTAFIGDTDGGALDGDPNVDRAVGPMQFIPSTWRRWAADLSGDGVADPQNIYDASLAAARYLCAGGRDMSTDAGMISGFLSYNRSQSYAMLVLARSRGYQLLGLL